jgi:hypothetical protein
MRDAEIVEKIGVAEVSGRLADMRTGHWFEQLLAVCARLRATRTTGKRNKRMVKRRNSHYASHDRTAPRHVPIDCALVMLEALPVTVRKRGKSV